MTLDIVTQIKELNTSKVHVKDKDRVNKLIRDIIDGGPTKLQIVSDFDRTITKQHENGKKHISSFGMFSLCKAIPQEYLEAEKSLTNKYFPLEIDPSIPHDKKRKLMEEWWAESEKVLQGLKVAQEDIEATAAAVGPSLRYGTNELFKDLNDREIPVLVFSAGLGNSVVAVLKHFDVYLPNVKVISNFLKYNDEGVIQGFQDAAIHVLNKNEFALKGTKYYDLVKDRDNVILMGDSLGDAGMADGIPHANAVLKIGFLYDHIKENLPNFMDTFDIVLEDDQSMDVVRGILKCVF